MSAEPGLVDANVLIYAMDEQASQYARARAFLDAARFDPASRLYVTSQILCEEYSIITNPRRVMAVRTPAEAIQTITGLLAFSGCASDPRPSGSRMAGPLAPPPCERSGRF